MHDQKRTVLATQISGCLLVGMVCFAPLTAQAGFQWIAPADSVAAPAPTYMAPAPRAQISRPEIISPVVIEGRKDQTLNPPALSAPVAANSADQAAASQAVTEMAPRMEKPVVGFANRVPLAVALRQVLPSDYGFSTDRDVNLSALVSWRGGQGWRETLRDMLKPAGLAMREDGQMIKIVRAADAAPTSMASAEISAKPSLSSGNLADSQAPMNVAAPNAISVTNGAGEHVLQLPPGMASDASVNSASNQTAMAAPVSAQGGAMMDNWTASRGDTLRKVLEDWTRKANVEFNWMAEYDYPLQASVVMNGSFEDAVRNLLSGFQEAQPQPVAELHNNPTAGQTVLVVQTRGNNYSE